MNFLTLLRSTAGVLLAGALTCLPSMATHAQVAIRRSPNAFNLFTVEQDIEIGQHAAAVFERQATLLRTARTMSFVTAVSNLIAAQVRGSPFTFRVSAINSSEVNAYALPGGWIFLTRGLLSTARNEAEVAALVAHAMAHIVLRHGTASASKAYFAKVGLSALGGLGDGPGVAQTMVNVAGGYGSSAAFLRFTRSDEYDADALGAEWLSKAGYDPVAMATVMQTLRRAGTRADRFFRYHPPADDREIRVRNLSNLLSHGRTDVVGGFARMRWSGGPASSWDAATKESNGTVAVRTTAVAPDIPMPSSEFTRFSSPDAAVEIDHPANWSAHSAGDAMSFAPSGGVVDGNEGAPSLLQGAIVNSYAPFENEVDRWNNSLTRHFAPFPDRSRPRGILEDATDDLVRQILNVNEYLRATPRSAKAEVVDGLRGYRVQLSGRSPSTGHVERIMVYTRLLPDEQVIYLACIAGAGRNAALVERACSRMAQSIRPNESANRR
jgi:hypothetical protein